MIWLSQPKPTMRPSFRLGLGLVVISLSPHKQKHFETNICFKFHLYVIFDKSQNNNFSKCLFFIENKPERILIHDRMFMRLTLQKLPKFPLVPEISFKNEQVDFKCERCNPSSMKKRTTSVVANLKKRNWLLS